MPVDRGEHVLAEIPQVVIEKLEYEVQDGIEWLEKPIVRPIPGGEEWQWYSHKYRKVTKTYPPHLKCDGFDAHVGRGGFFVKLESGTEVLQYWTGEIRVFVRCPRCRRQVEREDLEAHARLPHCPVAGCTATAPVNIHHVPFHLMEELGIPDVPKREWDSFRRLTETRPDLVLKQICLKAKKTGRILAVCERPGLPCARCDRVILVGDIIEKLLGKPADLLQRSRGAMWVHFYCATPSPDRENPRAALAPYYPAGDER